MKQQIVSSLSELIFFCLTESNMAIYRCIKYLLSYDCKMLFYEFLSKLKMEICHDTTFEW